MEISSSSDRRRLETLGRQQLAQHQLDRLNRLLQEILPANRFYAEKLAGCSWPLKSWDDLATLPFTTKDELIASGAADRAANLTFPLEQYVRLHRTSGTHGRPLMVLDTSADWDWWLNGWQFVLDAAGITARDRVLLAFSFGPFIGFWSAFEAAAARGALVVPTGGLGSVARLELLQSIQATAVFCTPSYALRLAEVAAEHNIDLAAAGVRTLVVAGEPGGSTPETRERIEAMWNARVVDHAGATEVGPWGYSDAKRRGLHVNESEFIAEFISVETGRPAVEGELSELILTTLGRTGAPVIRYRTGDLVRPVWQHGQETTFVVLDGGILGRVDDMRIIRGVNVFPSAVEAIVRSFPEVAEFRVCVRKEGPLDTLSLEVEDGLANPARIADALQSRLGLAIPVRCVAPNSLPRFEGKAQRWIDQR